LARLSWSGVLIGGCLLLFPQTLLYLFLFSVLSPSLASAPFSWTTAIALACPSPLSLSQWRRYGTILLASVFGRTLFEPSPRKWLSVTKVALGGNTVRGSGRRKSVWSTQIAWATGIGDGGSVQHRRRLGSSYCGSPATLCGVPRWLIVCLSTSFNIFVVEGGGSPGR